MNDSNLPSQPPPEPIAGNTVGLEIRETLGFQKAKIESLKDRLDEKSEDVKNLEKRVRKLETFKAFVIGIVVTAGAIGGGLWALIKFLK